MSDISHGPDWWQDEEGKWYPPDASRELIDTGEEQGFTTEPDETGEVNEGNIANHFKNRYGLEARTISIRGGDAKALGSEPRPWGPSKGDTKTRFMRPNTPADLFSGCFGMVGAILLAIGSFLDWASVGGSLTSGGVNAITDSNGIGTLVTGLLCAASAGLLLGGYRKRWVGLSLILISVVALVLTVYSLTDIMSTSDGIPANLIDRFPTIDQAYANEAKLDLGIGLWIALGGAVIAFFSGISGFKRNA